MEAISTGIKLPSARPPRSGVIPRLHLRRFSAAAQPVVAMVGDSSATDGFAASAHNVAPSETLWQILRRRLLEDNPGKAIIFHNFAIGGQSWQSLAGSPTVFPDFYTDRSLAWLAYPERVAPDLLAVALGCNDLTGICPVHVKKALAMIAGWEKVPDVILMTPKLPSRLAHPPYSDEEVQNAVVANASFLRTLSLQGGSVLGIPLMPNLGLIDLGRYHAMVRDGLDPHDQFLTLQLPIAALRQGLPCTLPSCDGDYDVAFTLHGAAPLLRSGELGYVGLTLGASKGGNIVYIQGNQNMFDVTAYPGDQAGGVTHMGGSVGDRDVRFGITCKAAHLIVRCNETIMLDCLMPRFVAPFRPQIVVGDATHSVTITIDHYAAGVARRFSPAIKETHTCCAFGASGGSTGGNGINHPSSETVAAVDYQMLEATRLCAAEADR